MTPEEWPIWNPLERGSLPPALRAGRDRLPTVRQDFFLDSDFRLTEQERALITAMLHRLVADIAAEIHAALPEDWLPANEDNEGLIERISKARLLDIEELMALFLRRADEERIAAACHARSPGAARSLIQPFVTDQDADVAAAAMAVLIARGRRRDRYGRAVVELDDVPPAAARSLIFAVAAGLREGLPVHIAAGEAEHRLYRATLTLIEKQDSSRSLDLQTQRLVARLGDAGRLDEELLGSAIELAEISFLAHALGHRAGLAAFTAFDELMSCDSRRVMTILRLAGVSRALAVHLLATLGDLIGLGSDAQGLDSFEASTDDQLDTVRSWLQFDFGFRAALRNLGHGNGHRTF